MHKDKDGNNAIGVRIISQDTTRFDQGKTLNDSKGSTLTPTAQRRKYRGARRMRNRYKLRRGKLSLLLDFLGMTPDKSFFTNEKGKRGENNDIGKAIYELRDKAIREKISLNEWGRIIMHLNQWRGYSSDRFKSVEKEDSDKGITSQVVAIEKSEDYSTIRREKKKEIPITYNTFIVSFENGDKIVEVRNKEHNESDYKLNDLYTYSFNDSEEIQGLKQVTKKKLNTESWAYKKKQINDSISQWCNLQDSTVGSYFYHNFYKENNVERIRNYTILRDWYEDEFDKIFNCQFENHKVHFQKYNIEEIIKVAFKDYHPILSDIQKKENFKEQLRFLIKDKIIFYQRPWQQAKNKGECPFEFVPDVKKEKDGSYIPNIHGKRGVDKNGNEIFLKGRTVIPRSHPLYQDYRMWQKINNLRIYLHTPSDKIDLFDDPEKFKEIIGKSIEETKELLYQSLQNCKSKAWKSFCADKLDLENYLFDNEEQARVSKKPLFEYTDKSTGEVSRCYFSVNFRKRKKDGTYTDLPLDGNKTKTSIRNILSDKNDAWFDEIHSSNITNLQLLWEIIYDITNSDINKVKEIIQRHFKFDNEAIYLQLANLKFDDQGMGNLSAKAIRQLLPLMSDAQNMTDKTRKRVESLISLNNSTEEQDKDGDEKLECLKDFVSDKKARKRLSSFKSLKDFKYLNYWEAAAIVYGSHSSKHIQTQKEILSVKQHSMNNPIVERIVNETISLVNEIHKVYGFDEVRIELCRELKASMDERQQMWESMNNNQARNEWAKRMLRELKSDNSSLDTETSTKSNLEKIRIIEDVVKQLNPTEYKEKQKEYKLDEPSKAEVKKYLMWLEQNFRCPYTDQPIPLTDVFARNKLVQIEHIIPKERYYSDAYSNKVITWQEVNQAKANNGNRTAYEFIVSKRVENFVKVGDRNLPLVSAEGWKEHVEKMFPKGAKRTNLLRKEIPEDPINRTLNETQYINKKLKEKLAELKGEQKVHITSGSITDILRDKWHLNKIFKEQLRNRFENFNIGENKERQNLVYWTNQFNPKTNKYENIEVFEGFTKRIDHRHHAMDAIIIACTKQNHIQYINSLNAINSVDQENEDSKKDKYEWIKKDVCIGNSSKNFITPWKEDKFITDIADSLNNIIISHKNTRLLISPSKHRVDKNINPNKIASIRGELHKETNYAKRNYFIEESRIPINKLVPQILKDKMDNQNQTMVHFKTFEEIIKETILKIKYQDVLIPLFIKYDREILSKGLCSEISKSILKKIDENKLLINSKTNEPLEWLSTYSNRDKSSRPLGLSMNLNDAKEVKNIADPRIKRLAEYRLKYVIEKKTDIDKLDISTPDKQKLKREIDAIPLYSNAIYEVRLRGNDFHERQKMNLSAYQWVELKNLKNTDVENIEYANKETTITLKNKLKELNLDELRQSYFTNPLFLSKKPIIVKKESDKMNLDVDRKIKFLKFIDAANLISHEKPSKISISKLYKLENRIDDLEYDLLFTLAKNDMVYLPEKCLSNDELLNIDWNNKNDIIQKLYVVKDMEASNEKIVFQHINKADAIKISEADAKSLFKNPDIKEQIEEIKYGTVPMLQRCIKVFTNKLGNKIVPYWEFPNGCWDKKRAVELGLIMPEK
nr:CRISPR-associated protein Cas9 [uncultured bacterium]